MCELIRPELTIQRRLRNWENDSTEFKRKRKKPPTVEEVMCRPGYAEAQKKILEIMDSGDLPDHIQGVWEMCRKPDADAGKITKRIDGKAWARKYARVGNALTFEEMERQRKEIFKLAHAKYNDYLNGLTDSSGNWLTGADWVSSMHEKYGRFYRD